MLNVLLNKQAKSQGQQGNFSALSKTNIKKENLQKQKLWEQNKTELVKQKEKISKNSYTQVSRNLDSIFT